MKDFFIKKYVFAFCFLGFVLIFSVINILHSKDGLREMGEELCEVQSVNELKIWLRSVESEVNEEIWGRMNFIETYGYVQKLAGKREFDGFSYIKGEDGMLYYGSLFRDSTDDLQIYAENVYRLNEYVKSRNAKLIVVLPPSKVLTGKSDIDPQWPVNDPNYRVDEFLNLLQRYEVTAVDLRTMMKQSDLDIDQIFFKTDHHWTPLAAFYAVGELVEQVRDHFDDDWDPERFYCNLDNYNSYTYFDCMLGSGGRDTGIVYSGTDDYTLLWPRFDTSFTWTDYQHDKVRRGSFSESLLDADNLKVKNWYGGSVNTVYLDENVKHDRIVNHKNPDGPRLAVLRDSYFSPMAAFLAPMCSEIDMVWGSSNHNDIDFNEFIRDNEYDYLILEVYSYNLDEKSFQFFQEEEQ